MRSPQPGPTPSQQLPCKPLHVVIHPHSFPAWPREALLCQRRELLLRDVSWQTSHRTCSGACDAPPWGIVCAAAAALQVGFKDQKLIRKLKVEARLNAVVNRLNGTKREVAHPDLAAEREAYEKEACALCANGGFAELL